ncbi:FecR family protein [Winogradskyella thalassocola]|uniref:Ferric-dicitrate binding protein FerR, regulates iron transport through sigma-19 n=1 Tax=Winogradskyella thalassocola TaxID=262004 RepID=A0A1G8I8R9_9FLAO|nr:FecR domain-containing protein [Winogradskyella thalassocola]SDI15274.1 ferric-dicitrate binding protein FerR, regulates iron transport through sigma-19 [Winogradskyella thalassocola]
MKREELIKKWLDHNLNTQEQNAFEQLEDYNELIKLDAALKDFKAPEFSSDQTYKTLKPEKTNSKQWLKPLLRIAAILAIGFSIYYYTTTLDTTVVTDIAQQTSIELPDHSTVDLNANSTVSFNESHWGETREVKLQGEAFFKVAKGQKFDVITADGIVSVLGTQFNVKQRDSYFEVTCYEGLVAVTHNNKTTKLKPGHTFVIIDGKLLANEKENAVQPQWLHGESSFTSVPLKHVIAEFESQYNQTIITENIDLSRLFTGSFTHNNLDLALKSVTIPLNLSYSKSEKSILLKRE